MLIVNYLDEFPRVYIEVMPRPRQFVVKDKHLDVLAKFVGAEELDELRLFIKIVRVLSLCFLNQLDIEFGAFLAHVLAQVVDLE